MKVLGFIIPSTIWLLSATTATALNPELDDPKWPGAKPEDGTTLAITVNIQYDESPEEVQWRLEEFNAVADSVSRQGVSIDIPGSTTEAPAVSTGTEAPQDGSNVVQGGFGTTDLARTLFNVTIENLLPDTRYRFVISDAGNNSGWVTLNTEAGLLWSLGGDLLSGSDNNQVVDLFVDESGAVGLVTVDLFGTSYSVSGTTAIDQSNEGLTGPIPREIGLMTALTYLNLGGNSLTGGIPTEFGKLTALTGMGLSENQLTGVITTELGMLTNLASLGLFGNQLTGTIPSELGLLTALTALAFSDNQLTGMLPWNLRADNLATFYAHGNQLSGQIPSGLCFITSLFRLTVDCEELPCSCGDVCVCDF